jgi:hypothetical protein
MARTTEALNGKLVPVLFGIVSVLFTIIIAMFGFWLSEQSKDLAYVQQVASNNAIKIAALENRNIEILRAIELRLAAIEQELRSRGRP